MRPARLAPQSLDSIRSYFSFGFYGFFSLLLMFLLMATNTHALVCSAEQTASYLTEGTDYVLKQKVVDYVIVVDASGSMNGQKLEKVKQAAKTLVNQLPAAERAAIISFNYNATIQQALTSNHDALYSSLDAIKAAFSTQYAPPLIAAREQFMMAGSNKALIFLSDGKSDYGETQDEILTITDSLIAQGACILTVSYALGGEESELLKTMAERGKTSGCGEHFIASEQGSELEEVFSSIHDTLSANDLISITPMLTNVSYAFSFSSKLNNLPLPGTVGDACTDEPTITLTFHRNNKLVDTYGPESRGMLALPAGTYSYRAIANLRCDGACGYTGSIEGNLTVDGVCNPSYPDLATYVTGETQHVVVSAQGFAPSVVSGRQGTVVVWTNQDTATHRVQSAYFDETLEPDASFSYVIGNIGTLIYGDPDRNLTGQLIPIKGTGTDVLLIIDESGSMKGQGIIEARDAARQFFGLLSSADRGSLMTFSQDAHILQDFTSDVSLLQTASDKIISKGPTNYLSALRLASTVQPRQKGVLVFMSDGTPTDQEGEQAILAETEKLRAKGWCIMTVGFGQEGAQAKNVLSAMAGDDRCSAFLYASTGSLAQAFGTIYQLSHAQNDLVFSDVSIPIITFTKNIRIRTEILTKTGKTVPGGEDVCSPPARVQARSSAGSSEFSYVQENMRYEATLPMGRTIEHVSLIAAVASPDEPGRTFVGETSQTVVYVPYWLVLLLVAVLIGASSIIYRKLYPFIDEDERTS